MREIGWQDKTKTMFNILRDLQDDLQLSNTLRSYDMMRDAVYKEECNGVKTRCIFDSK
jgi:hypothetical protein